MVERVGERGSSAFRAYLRSLPDTVAEAVERGFVARMQPGMDPAAQRLFASLKLPVLFDEGAAPLDLEKLLAALGRDVSGDPVASALLRARRALGVEARIWERVVELLADGEPRRLEEVHRAVGGQYEQVHKELGKLVRAGVVAKPAKGVYQAVSGGRRGG